MVRFRFAITTVVIFLAPALAAAQAVAVSGRVSNARGGVIANADVTLRPLPPPGTPSTPRMPNMPGMATNERTTRSGTDGAFTLAQVPPGQYVLEVDAPGFERSSQQLTVANANQTLAIGLDALDLPGTEATAQPAGAAAVDTQALLDRIKVLEARLTDLESSTVLSEPETRVKRIEVYVDRNGNEHDDPVPGATKRVTYQRERVYRRQWLSEKLEQAFADQDSKKIAVGVSAANVTQLAGQTRGASATANGHAYQLSSADLFFSAGLAQYTSFFADVVGLSGAAPDG